MIQQEQEDRNYIKHIIKVMERTKDEDYKKQLLSILKKETKMFNDKHPNKNLDSAYSIY